MNDLGWRNDVEYASEDETQEVSSMIFVCWTCLGSESIDSLPDISQTICEDQRVVRGPFG